MAFMWNDRLFLQLGATNEKALSPLLLRFDLGILRSSWKCSDAKVSWIRWCQTIETLENLKVPPGWSSSVFPTWLGNTGRLVKIKEKTQIFPTVMESSKCFALGGILLECLLNFYTLHYPPDGISFRQKKLLLFTCRVPEAYSINTTHSEVVMAAHTGLTQC